MNKEEEARVKNAIENMEYFITGLNHISGARVQIVNLRSRFSVWVYDLIQYNDDVKTRYNECYLSKSMIQKYLEKEAKK